MIANPVFRGRNDGALVYAGEYHGNLIYTYINNGSR